MLILNYMKKEEIKERLEELAKLLHIKEAEERIIALNKELADPNLWQNPEEGNRVALELSLLQNKFEKFKKLKEELEKAEEEELSLLEQKISDLELETFLSGRYDNKPAILSVHTGLGGVDAQDFAEMIFKMYLKLAERKGWQAEVAEFSRGEEAGIKKATAIFTGDYAYGWLKGEAGVHRLIRLSPFNARNLRQTSFCLVDVIPEIEEEGIEIKPADLKLETFRSSGHGGQSVNTTDSAIRLTHLPTGISVAVQAERSQFQNRAMAMRILQSKLERLSKAQLAEEKALLRGEVPQAAWGSQIRTYTLHPYTLVKDHRTSVETSDVSGVFNGNLDLFLKAEVKIKGKE